jgi:hypothetical protein
MHVRQLLLLQRSIAFFVLNVGIFGGLLATVHGFDFVSATSDDEGGDTGSGGDNGGGDNGGGGGGGDEPEPEPEPEPGPEPEPEPNPNPGLVPGPEPPVDPCLENPEAEGCTPEPPTDPCIVDPITGEAQCNPDEVVTGRGYEISELGRISTVVTTFKEFAANNAWRIEMDNPTAFGTLRIFAECLKLVPA